VLIVVVGILVSGHKAKRREERGGDG